MCVDLNLNPRLLAEDNPRLNAQFKKERITLNLQITYVDRECCPGPCVVATRARRNPRCISPAIDNAPPSRRTETDSSIRFSIIPPRYRVRCNVKSNTFYASLCELISSYPRVALLHSCLNHLAMCNICPI